MWKIALSFWHGIGEKAKAVAVHQDHHHPMALPYYLAQRDAKRHSKCEVFYCHKVFQTSNREK